MGSKGDEVTGQLVKVENVGKRRIHLLAIKPHGSIHLCLVLKPYGSVIVLGILDLVSDGKVVKG